MNVVATVQTRLKHGIVCQGRHCHQFPHDTVCEHGRHADSNALPALHPRQDPPGTRLHKRRSGYRNTMRPRSKQN